VFTDGLQHFSRADLGRAEAAGQRLQIKVAGLAGIADDVTADWRLPPSIPWRSWAPSSPDLQFDGRCQDHSH
jgi:hypothetical protein